MKPGLYVYNLVLIELYDDYTMDIGWPDTFGPVIGFKGSKEKNSIWNPENLLYGAIYLGAV